jgi:hypothetical protein
MMHSLRPQGLVSITGFSHSDGKRLSTQDAVDLGLITPVNVSGWDLEKSEVPIGLNVCVDGFRQTMAYAIAGVANNNITQFQVGTGDPTLYPPNVSDVSLIAPITLSSGSTYKAIDGIDFPSPFIARVQFTLGSADANGYLITEMGLFTGAASPVLLARKTFPGLNKQSSFSPSFSWRLRC